MTGKGFTIFMILVVVLVSLVIVLGNKTRRELRAREQQEEGCVYLSAARDIPRTYFYQCGLLIEMKKVK